MEYITIGEGVFTDMVYSLLLAIAVSLDSLGVGFSYGLRNIRIPFLSKCIIAGCSGMVIFVAMEIGYQLKRWISASSLQFVGVVILISLGCFAIVQALRPERDQGDSPLQTMVNILRTPALADRDQSGSISSWEAIWLGLALALDAFGAGLGAAMLSFPAVWLSFWIAITAGCFLHIGIVLGLRVMALGTWTRYLSCLPGVLLILLGLSRLW